ncbi:hypothetical protein QJ850_gp635 [Acanthamoeba polyphaga mimivirus]|uniref:Uncharacterized protein n=1 Tax=Acanthamoeba polyphaga mimivirus Kroon TaxID=3069720 RepID=A0A0G2Y693_9VIRU|nr:hypothetical protein QJ850_gp635 [Acanthamoeba polyphaga mimivirus]AKI80064.1 hypothetical protein [Acanthamoeba polyphaga mimivirus Kroon]
MAFNNSTIIIIIVIAFAFFLIYSQNNQPKIIQQPVPQISQFKSQLNQPQNNQHNGHLNPSIISPQLCPKCDKENCSLEQISPSRSKSPTPQITNVHIEHESDPYSDPIKKQDIYGMMDPLTFPQQRLPREVLQKYQEYYDKNGSYPPFGQNTQPLFDNPVLAGILIKQVDENEPFTDNVPSSIPLFKVKSNKNSNRFFYYIIDQRYFSKLELKIPLDSIRVNGVRYNNAEFYGIPELFDGDVIDNIALYPSNRFSVKLYKIYSFP